MFKVGDWAIEGYDIIQITRIDADGVVSVSDGSFSKSGYKLRCFPLTLANKRAAGDASFYMNQLHNAKGHNLLDFSGISRAFEGYVESICNLPEDESREPLFKEMDDFYREICRKLEETVNIKVNNVRLFGRL